MSSTPSTPSEIARISQPLASAGGWMKFLGIVFIIQGALTALSIVGILVAWLPIWMGILLMQAADSVDRARRQDDAGALAESMQRLKTFFVIQGVMMLVTLGLVVLSLLFFGAISAAMLHHGSY